MDGVYFLSILVLFSNIITVIVGIFLLTDRIIRIEAIVHSREKIRTLIDKYALQILLLVSATATLGSLYLSEVRGFAPCRLCWYQRIFMYPVPVLFMTSIYKKTKDVFLYTLPLSMVGLFIAGYHYYLQLNPSPYAPCGDIGFSVSCSENFFTHFGYITIPWMSFSAFAIIASISLLQLKARRTKRD